MLTDGDALTLDIPRDHAGTFVPQLVPKHIRQLPSFNDKVLSLYSRRVTVRDIQAHLEDLYQVEIAPRERSHSGSSRCLNRSTRWYCSTACE